MCIKDRKLQKKVVNHYSLLFSAISGLLCTYLSVRLSVCHTRGLCPHGSTYDHDFNAGEMFLGLKRHLQNRFGY